MAGDMVGMVQGGFTFVACVNAPDVAARYLLASPCLAEQRHPLVLAQGMGSAGQGFALGACVAATPWLVMVHQDVYLPAGWDAVFAQAMQTALAHDPKLAVVGVYGVQASGEHVGHVFDRDRWLGMPPVQALPVRSLDELLLAVRLDSGVVVDPALGWHLYGTDVCLQAHAMGLTAAVVAAPCEHHSSLPRDPAKVALGAERDRLQNVVDAFNESAAVFVRKWSHVLPVVTPIASIHATFRFDLEVG